MSIQLATLSLSQRILNRLHTCGYFTSADIIDLTPSQLAKDLGITYESAKKIFDSLNPDFSHLFLNINDFSRFETIPTSILELDNLLCGGIPRRTITDLSGPSGIGKTLIARSLYIE
jgi:predicted ATP-dependent serine protease